MLLTGQPDPMVCVLTQEASSSGLAGRSSARDDYGRLVMSAVRASPERNGFPAGARLANPTVMIALAVVLAVAAFNLWIRPRTRRGSCPTRRRCRTTPTSSDIILRDENGGLLPLYLSSFGDYKSPLFTYTLAAVFRVTGRTRRSRAASPPSASWLPSCCWASSPAANREQPGRRGRRRAGRTDALAVRGRAGSLRGRARAAPHLPLPARGRSRPGKARWTWPSAAWAVGLEADSDRVRLRGGPVARAAVRARTAHLLTRSAGAGSPQPGGRLPRLRSFRSPSTGFGTPAR